MKDEYVDHLKTEFGTKKKKIEEEKCKLEKAIRENEQRMEQFQPEKVTGYDLFTPRSVRLEEKKKIQELKEEKENLVEQEKYLNQQLEENERNVVCIQKVEQKFRIMEKDEENREQRDNEEKQNKEVLEKILRKVELCYRLIDIDQNRCKLEMTGVMEQLQSEIRTTIEPEICEKQ